MNFLNNLIEMFGSASFWVKTLEMILALSLLVIVHEFGHYTFARIFGMRVNKFYMFFNPKFSILRWDPKRKTISFFKKNPEDEDVAVDKGPDNAQAQLDEAGHVEDKKASWRDTVYGIGWIPLGGYCSIAGMVDETTSADQLSEKAQPWEFRSRPAWQRLLVMIGGVLFNFLMAIVIYAGIVWSYGELFINFSDATEGMDYHESLHKVGFKDGDILLAADGENLTYFCSDQVNKIIMAREVRVLRDADTIVINLPEKFIFNLNDEVEKGDQLIVPRLPVVIAQTQNNMGAEKAGLRSGDRIIAVNNDTTPSYTELTPALMKYKGTTARITYLRDGQQRNTQAEIDDGGKLGIQLMDPTKIFNTTIKHYNILQSIPRGIEMGWEKMTSYFKSLKMVATPEGAKSLGGFGAIGSIFPDTWNWLDFWSITAFLAVILAVMNILPIPILDGGYVLFLLIEMVTGWKPSEKVMNIALNIGLGLLIVLMLYANLNDVYRFVIK